MSGFYESQFTGAEIDQAILYARYSGLKNASDYNNDAVYSVGSYCINDGKLYRCITAISSAEPWNPENWEETSVDAELSRKADLDDTGKINSSQLPSMDYVPTSEKGVANGVATLGEDGKVPAEQVDAYSQSDSISAETRTALSLPETATPDAALAEIARQLSERITLLWENASPTSEFSAQTLSINTDGCLGIIVSFVGRTTDFSSTVGQDIVNMTIGTEKMTIWQNSSLIEYRGFKWASTSEILFYDAMEIAQYGSSSTRVTINKDAIPYRIYGIKV